jgi:predicted MFS family arabinose efflux permease
MDGEIVVPFVFFLFLAAIILVPIYLRERTKQSAHALISQALEKGQTLDPQLLKQLTDSGKPQQDKARRSLGSGIVLLALAGGFVAGAFVMDGFDPSGYAHNGMLVPAVILGALGVAFILLAIVDYATKRKDQ